MAEYIERDAVINDIGDLFTICYETLPNEYGHHFIVEKELQTHLDFVRNLPAADVVEVVRCKDCVHCQHGSDYSVWCDAWCSENDSYRMNKIIDDGYCYRGKQKGGSYEGENYFDSHCRR